MHAKLRDFLTKAYDLKVLGRKSNLHELFCAYSADADFVAAAYAELERLKRISKERDFAGHCAGEVLATKMNEVRTDAAHKE